MKLVTYLRGGKVSVGILQDEMIIDVSETFPDMLSIIKEGEKGLKTLKGIISSNPKRLPFNKDNLLAPIPKVERNVICVGWNYLKHFHERVRQDIELPERPAFFTKATTTVAGPFESVSLPVSNTSQLDYEAELAVVIGMGGKNIPEAEALNHIYGYMCANDLTARDIQQGHGGQWFMGKSLDKSCPIGPWILTKDEVPDPQNLEISCLVNGESVQLSNTSLMIFPIRQIVSELSRVMTLIPGDIILTGTPSGIGSKRNPPLFLRDGDVVEVKISNVGNIINKINQYNDSYESLLK